MSPNTPPDRLRAILSILEEEKRNGKVDQQIADDLRLLIAVSRLPGVSTQAIEANIKNVVNAKIAALLITGRR